MVFTVNGALDFIENKIKQEKKNPANYDLLSVFYNTFGFNVQKNRFHQVVDEEKFWEVVNNNSTV